MQDDEDHIALDHERVLIPSTGEVYIWPNCTTADCPHKQCTWGGMPLCYPCSERVVGTAEMIRRYNETHDITWGEAQRLDAEEDEG